MYIHLPPQASHPRNRAEATLRRTTGSAKSRYRTSSAYLNSTRRPRVSPLGGCRGGGGKRSGFAEAAVFGGELIDAGLGLGDRLGEFVSRGFLPGKLGVQGCHGLFQRLDCPRGGFDVRFFLAQ